MNAQNIILAILLAVVGTMLALIYANMVKKDSNNKNAIKALQNLASDIEEKENNNVNSNLVNLAPSPISSLNNEANNNAANNNASNNNEANNNAANNNAANNNAANNNAANNLDEVLNNLNEVISAYSPAEELNNNMELLNNNNELLNSNGENFYGGNHHHYNSHNGGKCGKGFGLKDCGDPSQHSLETFENHPEGNKSNKESNNSGEDLKKENEKLKKYLKIHGLYPENHAIDMSKYVLKTAVKQEKRCPDMSKYVLKTSIPPPVKCPKINRDEFIRKSELPPNWNKECPAHPDLTNYVLKSTIPPTTKSQACICPKVTVNAGLCREPSKDDCMAMKDVLQEACPKPQPCPEKKCPELKCPEPDPKFYIKRSELPPDWNKKCPEPPPPPPPCPRIPAPPPCPAPICPACPEPPKVGKCPPPERCSPAEKDCPKCYDIKYIKTPVVKSEPLPKPDKQTIFPTNLIETKLVRQQTPPEPRQPKILKLEQGNRNNENYGNNNNLRDIVNEMNNNSNNLEPEDEVVNTQVEDNMVAPPPSAMVIDNSSFMNAAPVMTPMYSRNDNKPKNLFNKVVEKIRNVGNNTEKANRKYPKELEGKCQKEDLNKMFNKFGVTGFNNQL